MMKRSLISQHLTLNSVYEKLGVSRQKDFGIGPGMKNDDGYTLYQ